MSSIRTYEDLEAEEKRLQALLYSNKANIKDSFSAVKDSLNPFKQAIDTVKKFLSRDKTNPIMKFGVDFGLDILIRRLLLSKAGWFTKLVVPFVVRNYSSHFLTQYKRLKIIQKIVGFFKSNNDEVKLSEQEVWQSRPASTVN